jgi:hypothetical protein
MCSHRISFLLKYTSGTTVAVSIKTKMEYWAHGGAHRMTSAVYSVWGD